ncbi:hypothetical protein POPTR_006G066150v4 [Populus trichocarpa]|uniref:Uncharacterized protein n=1 Tax=Populus trichocarpa TaxID=3694 RepID=A0ACC0SSN3_POPTR|nr:hypothetical protein POPTR_006G066150v4 [Populus trichocarpa]
MLRRQKKAMLVRFNPKTDLHVKVIVKYDLRLSRANITFSGLFAFPAFTSRSLLSCFSQFLSLACLVILSSSHIDATLFCYLIWFTFIPALLHFPINTYKLFAHIPWQILSVFPLLFSIQRFQEEAVPGARQSVICTNNNKSRCQLLQFTLQELKSATANFRPDSNILREGGLGYVFKGWIGENGTSLAN